MLADFKRLMAARFFFNFASQMQAVLMGWQMYSLTHDPLYLGLVGLAEAIPAIGLALFAGYIVDRSRPLLIYGNVIIGSLLSGVVLLLSLVPQLRLDDRQQILALFLAAFVTGAARGFSQPAMFAIVPRIMPRDQLSKASAWMTSAMQVARIGGPAAGGLVFASFGAEATAALVCIFLVCSAVAVITIKIAIPAPPPAQVERRMKEEFFSGAAFVFAHPILLPAMSLDMISVLFGGVTALLPIYASEILHTGAMGLGWLRAAPSAGAVITSMWLTRADIKAKAGTWLFGCVAAFGVCILVFGLSTTFWISVAALAVSGAVDSISMVIRSSAVQLTSPDSMRGKIAAVNSIFIGSSNEIGEFESGVAARLMGTVPSVIFGGVMCLLTVVVTYAVSPQLRGLHLGKLENESGAVKKV
jgi:MFS family permease